MEIITRKKYIDKLLSFLNKGMILALTGQRRVGKSYILRDLAQIIEQTYPLANIIYINKEKKTVWQPPNSRRARCLYYRQTQSDTPELSTDRRGSRYLGVRAHFAQSQRRWGVPDSYHWKQCQDAVLGTLHISGGTLYRHTCTKPFLPWVYSVPQACWFSR